MKKNQTDQASAGNRGINRSAKRVENKDNLDSREREEQQFKGDDITHNRKENKSKKPHMSKNENQEKNQ